MILMTRFDGMPTEGERFQEADEIATLAAG